MDNTKSWYKSQTLISLAGIIAGVFLPRYAPVIPQTLGDAVTIISTLSAAWGRISATSKIQTNQKVS